MKLFTGGYISRESCENCQFKGYSRVSDLTICDFWGIWDIAPEMDDNKGTSVVLVQSPYGAALLKKIGERLVLKEVSLEEASRQNQAMIKTSAPNVQRQEALSLIKEGRIADCNDGFAPVNQPLVHRLIRKIQKILSKGG